MSSFFCALHFLCSLQAEKCNNAFMVASVNARKSLYISVVKPSLLLSLEIQECAFVCYKLTFLGIGFSAQCMYSCLMAY